MVENDRAAAGEGEGSLGAAQDASKATEVPNVRAPEVRAVRLPEFLSFDRPSHDALSKEAPLTFLFREVLACARIVA